MPLPVSQPSLERFDQRVLAIKADVTEGTDPVPATATNAFQILNGTQKLSATDVARNVDRNVYTGKPKAKTNPIITISGDVELIPPTTPGDATGAGVPPVSPLLLPGGFKIVKTAAAVGPPAVVGETRYKPITKLIPSATSYWYHNGTFAKLISARHAFSAIKLAIDDRFTAKVDIQAAYTAIDEADLPTDMDYSAFGIPTIADDTNTVMLVNVAGSESDDVHVMGKSLQVDLGSKLLTKRFTERRFNAINGMDPKFTLLLARPAKSDFDFYALWTAGTIITSSFKLLEPDGRYSIVGIRGQIDDVADTNTDDDDLITVTGTCIASDSSSPTDGSDFCYIAFGGP